MSFDEENNENGTPEANDNKPKSFFGLQLSNGVEYTIVVILALILIRQLAVVFQALG